MTLVLEEEAGMWEISFFWGKVVTRFLLGVSELVFVLAFFHHLSSGFLKIDNRWPQIYLFNL